MRKLFGGLVVALVLCNASCGNSPPAQDSQAGLGQAIADANMEMLKTGSASAVASGMHYPPTYTPEQRFKDVNGTTRDIELALRELGPLSDVHPFTGSDRVYTSGTTGGSLPYLRSLSPDFSADYYYQVHYRVAGAGYVHLKVIRLNAQSPPEVLQVEFQLPASDPGALARMSDLGQKELEAMGVQVTPEVRKQIEAAMVKGATGGH
jgi:hypothetical protein